MGLEKYFGAGTILLKNGVLSRKLARFRLNAVRRELTKRRISWKTERNLSVLRFIQ
jgi:hypothetical protein